MFLTDHELPTTSIDNIEDLTQELDLEVDNNKDMLDGEGNNSIPSQSNINNEVRKKANATLVDASRINKRGGSDEKRGPSKIKKRKIEKSKYFLSHAHMRFNRNLQKASLLTKVLNMAIMGRLTEYTTVMSCGENNMCYTPSWPSTHTVDVFSFYVKLLCTRRHT
ncbi:hypothetical protein RN001_015685 [Aquatica leii]|uniref:Uncharacterized protein n=1 Tax=Aquatica leii TaxID=1421715 RepID=A0AAN7S5S4_9COLE|nr:hypothetical protein RN001_015685 [Aquatica leii]